MSYFIGWILNYRFIHFESSYGIGLERIFTGVLSFNTAIGKHSIVGNDLIHYSFVEVLKIMIDKNRVKEVKYKK